jgi:hypothetical protein
MFKFVNDLENPVSLFDGFIQVETQLGGVFEDNGFANEPLDAFAVLLQFRQSLFPLVFVAEHADVNGGGLEVTGYLDVVYSNEPGGADGNFTADNFTQFAFQQFLHPLEPERRHNKSFCLITVFG